MTGLGQPFSFSTSKQLLEQVLSDTGRGSDVFRWVRDTRSSDIGNFKLIEVELWVSTLTASASVSASTPIRMQIGFIDVKATTISDDQITITCRDASALLWEARSYEVFRVAPTTVDYIRAVMIGADISGGLRGSAVGANGTTFNTISSPTPPRALGILDATGLTHYSVNDGVRLWDILQYSANIDDCYAFVDRGTLWYINELDLRLRTGAFILQLGWNLETFRVEQSTLQSGDVVVIMAIANTKNVFQGTRSRTAYVVVEGLDKRPSLYASLPPQLLERFRGKRIYRFARYDLDTAAGLEPFNEARAAFREVVTRQFIVSVEFAGHASADLFNRYRLRGTGSILNANEFVPMHITHTINVNSGWGCSMVMTNTVSDARMESFVGEGQAGPVGGGEVDLGTGNVIQEPGF